MPALAMRTPLPPGRQVLVTEFADSPSEAIERSTTLVAQPPPDPSSLGPDEVVVGIRAASVGWVDLLMTSGQYQHMAEPPYCPGIEYAGVVERVGAGVDPARCREGDRVIVDFMQVGPRTGGAYRRAGGFASYAVVPAQAVVPIPARLDFDQAACLLGAYETAHHCLVTRAQLRAGETVLVTGASGATGLAAVQVARRLGATVIGTGRSDAKLAVVRALGADHVVNSRGGDGEPEVRRFRDEVKALTGGRGVDVVYDTVGGDVSLECLRCVDFGARFVIVGWTSTPDVARGRGQRGAPRANQLPTNLIQMKGLSVLGAPAVISVGRDPTLRPPRLAQVLAWAASGEIAPQVSHAFPLERFREAMRARWEGEVIGGCVLRP
ncbi:MAG: NADPH:quinone oxidoreductase family protein [Burkholderiales bacterium]|nr:MAG: NADPH:quinone oxidoreductase family protein [Burkholderiales bacterium]